MNVEPVRTKPPHVPWGSDSDIDLDDGQSPVEPLTREEALALVARQRSVSPWRVVWVQAAVGLIVALLARWVSGRNELAWSALWGAVVVVVPGALMARGMTSALTSVSPGVSAVSFMSWELLKIAASVGLLMLAPKLVQPLSWPALLVALVLCLNVYWLALAWRRSPKNSN